MFIPPVQLLPPELLARYRAGGGATPSASEDGSEEDITEVPELRAKLAAGEIDPARVVPESYRAPSHIGMRRYAEVHPDKPMDEWFWESTESD